MKIELITIKEFIEQAECYFRNYMDGLRRNAPDDFYYFLNNKYNMNDIMESIIKKRDIIFTMTQKKAKGIGFMEK
ncbi:hypothetical protein G715_04796 [Escherichia coli HVH 40 (4-1219782)]|nr:hypothetical protein [Escherichia coli]EQO47402.1 hypothetical protein G715_04796 [Escherichia coli HVH 40 (4-1219782)]